MPWTSDTASSVSSGNISDISDQIQCQHTFGPRSVTSLNHFSLPPSLKFSCSDSSYHSSLSSSLTRSAPDDVEGSRVSTKSCVDDDSAVSLVGCEVSGQGVLPLQILRDVFYKNTLLDSETTHDKLAPHDLIVPNDGSEMAVSHVSDTMEDTGNWISGIRSRNIRSTIFNSNTGESSMSSSASLLHDLSWSSDQLSTFLTDSPIQSRKIWADHTDNSHSRRFSWSSAAEEILASIGFSATDSALPERFAKDWLSKILRVKELLSQQKRTNVWDSLSSVSKYRRFSDLEFDTKKRLSDVMSLSSLRRDSTSSERHNDQNESLEKLIRIIERQRIMLGMTSDEALRHRRKFSLSRQKSLPTFLHTLSEEDEASLDLSRNRYKCDSLISTESSTSQFSSKFIHDDQTSDTVLYASNCNANKADVFRYCFKPDTCSSSTNIDNDIQLSGNDADTKDSVNFKSSSCYDGKINESKCDKVSNILSTVTHPNIDSKAVSVIRSSCMSAQSTVTSDRNCHVGNVSERAEFPQTNVFNLDIVPKPAVLSTPVTIEEEKQIIRPPGSAHDQVHLIREPLSTLASFSPVHVTELNKPNFHKPNYGRSNSLDSMQEIKLCLPDEARKTEASMRQVHITGCDYTKATNCSGDAMIRKLSRTLLEQMTTYTNASVHVSDGTLSPLELILSNSDSAFDSDCYYLATDQSTQCFESDFEVEFKLLPYGEGKGKRSVLDAETQTEASKYDNKIKTEDGCWPTTCFINVSCQTESMICNSPTLTSPFCYMCQKCKDKEHDVITDRSRSTYNVDQGIPSADIHPEHEILLNTIRRLRKKTTRIKRKEHKVTSDTRLSDHIKVILGGSSTNKLVACSSSKSIMSKPDENNLVGFVSYQGIKSYTQQHDILSGKSSSLILNSSSSDFSERYERWRMSRDSSQEEQCSKRLEAGETLNLKVKGPILEGYQKPFDVITERKEERDDVPAFYDLPATYNKRAFNLRRLCLKRQSGFEREFSSTTNLEKANLEIKEKYE